MLPGQWLVIASVLAGVGTLFLIGLVWQYRDKPGARWFLASLGCQAVWSWGYALALLTFDPAVRFAFEVVVWTAMATMSVTFLAFALEYTGRGRSSRRTRGVRCYWYALHPWSLFVAVVGALFPPPPPRRQSPPVRYRRELRAAVSPGGGRRRVEYHPDDGGAVRLAVRPGCGADRQLHDGTLSPAPAVRRLRLRRQRHVRVPPRDAPGRRAGRTRRVAGRRRRGRRVGVPRYQYRGGLFGRAYPRRRRDGTVTLRVADEGPASPTRNWPSSMQARRPTSNTVRGLGCGSLAGAPTASAAILPST